MADTHFGALVVITGCEARIVVGVLTTTDLIATDDEDNGIRLEECTDGLTAPGIKLTRIATGGRMGNGNTCGLINHPPNITAKPCNAHTAINIDH